MHQQQSFAPRRWTSCLAYALTSLVAIFLLLVSPAKSSDVAQLQVSRDSIHALSKYAVDGTTAVLRPFEVYPPVLVPEGHAAELSDGYSPPYPVDVNLKRNGCVVHQTLMTHSFANSYGMPFIGQYTPPSCSFNRIVWNLTVAAAGRQFDRLGIVYFGDTELWRTSTAEPTSTGIEWVYLKDMSNYLALFRKPQTLIFDLGNLVDSTYTAPYNATLSAVFYTAGDTIDPADQILSISQGMSNAPSVFQVPPMQASTSLTLPRNTRKAILSISATGQIGEEFWFGNVLTDYADTFGPGFLLPDSPFREVQLLIDGKLAGVVWPFPIIFTGGVVPGLWRPIVGIDAFDLKEDEIDITPWLPLLCDGASHQFEVRIAGVRDNNDGTGSLTKSVGSYWLVTGKVFLWLDPAGHITTGSMPSRHVPHPSITLSNSVGMDNNGTNQTYVASLNVKRQLSISANVITAAGKLASVWSQKLTYSNRNDFTNYGNIQATTQHTDGYDLSSDNYSRHINYPIFVNSSYVQQGNNFTIGAEINRGQTIQIFGQPVFPTGLGSFEDDPTVQNKYPTFQGSNLQTTQSGTGEYQSFNNQNAISSGSTQQQLIFEGVQFSGKSNGKTYPRERGSSELYERRVSATNGTVTSDHQRFLGRPYRGRAASQPAGKVSMFAWTGTAKRLLGRRPPA